VKVEEVKADVIRPERRLEIEEEVAAWKNSCEFA
jgi:hypothetical protein